ncbi:MAG: hypothetical protein EHM70_20365, partial [Chloroflexota bacterium]
MPNYIRSFKELGGEEEGLAGGKGRVLAELYRAGYPIPDGFVILPAAFCGDELKPEAWQQVGTYLERLRRAGRDTTFAVRSSGLSEDAAAASYAGEFETVLSVERDDEVLRAIAAVRSSRDSLRLQAYSQAQGQSTGHEMAVVVQRMVRPDLAGVLFTVNPVSGSLMEMAGNFVHGLGESLVSGQANAETFTFDKPGGKYH